MSTWDIGTLAAQAQSPDVGSATRVLAQARAKADRRNAGA
jgi:hypothetical protein